MLTAKLRSRVPKILRRKAWRLEGKAGIEVVGHRAYIGGKWDEYGQMEFDFMVAHGLRPEHVLLDIACGSLRAGIHFIADNCPTPNKNLPETMLAGVALLDYDNDGYQDIYFVNSAAIPSLKKESPKYWNRLFHNNRDGTFTDVTEKAGVKGE